VKTQNPKHEILNKFKIRMIEIRIIPLNPPLEKGDLKGAWPYNKKWDLSYAIPPLEKRDLKGAWPYNKKWGLSYAIPPLEKGARGIYNLPFGIRSSSLYTPFGKGGLKGCMAVQQKMGLVL